MFPLLIYLISAILHSIRLSLSETFISLDVLGIILFSFSLYLASPPPHFYSDDIFHIIHPFLPPAS